jgi:hypothetical protein
MCGVPEVERSDTSGRTVPRAPEGGGGYAPGLRVYGWANLRVSRSHVPGSTQAVPMGRQAARAEKSNPRTHRHPAEGAQNRRRGGADLCVRSNAHSSANPRPDGQQTRWDRSHPSGDSRACPLSRESTRAKQSPLACGRGLG